MSETTTFLYATPSATEGMGRLVDLAGIFDDYNYTPEALTDLIAIALDWKTVGNDLRAAIRAELEAHGFELAS